MDEPPAPFDRETWRRMVELVNFLKVEKLDPAERERLGQALEDLPSSCSGKFKSEEATEPKTER